MERAAAAAASERDRDWKTSAASLECESKVVAMREGEATIPKVWIGKREEKENHSTEWTDESAAIVAVAAVVVVAQGAGTVAAAADIAAS